MASGGYGMFRFEGRMQVAHRVSWKLLVGPIATGIQLDHLCRNRKCVNPDHLEPVTQRENIHRSPLKGSETHCRNGHEYAVVGVYMRRDRNTRMCRECRRVNMARFLADNPDYHKNRKR